MKLSVAYRLGRAKALEKLALGPPTQVDQFVSNVESGKDVPPAPPPMAQGAPPALDGTTPLDIGSTSPPTPQDTIGSTIGQPPLPGDPAAQPAPMMGALHG
jgi:hypothetical protein